MESSRCPLSVLCTAANFPATMLPLHASLTASRQFLASMGRRYLGCYTGNMRHNLIPNARPSEMVQQNLFILYSKHIVVHDRNRVCNFWNLHHTLRQKLNANPWHFFLFFPKKTFTVVPSESIIYSHLTDWINRMKLPIIHKLVLFFQSFPCFLFKTFGSIRWDGVVTSIYHL